MGQKEMRALITGGTGFIGSHLAEALIEKGFDVTCIVRDKSRLKNLTNLPVKLVEANCEKSTTLDSIGTDYDYVFHLAGLTKAPNAEAFFSANVVGTENLINLFLRARYPLKRFVYISSLSAVGPAATDSPLTEDCQPMPVSDYGRSKLKAEEIVFSKRQELPITIIRPPAVYGPRDRDMLVLFKLLNKGIALCWGDGLYSLIYIDDLINGIILSSLLKEAEGEIFFMTDGNIYTNIQIIDTIAEALDKRPFKVRVPEFCLTGIALVAEVLKEGSIINADKIRELKQKRWICLNTKASERLGFEPQTDFREGAKWTANWYKGQKWI